MVNLFHGVASILMDVAAISRRLMGKVEDLGSNIGLFSIATARKAPLARVFAIEACRENFTPLQAHLKANGSENVAIRHLALSAQCDTVALTVDLHSTCHRAVESTNPEFEARTMRTDLVEAVSLDALFEVLGIESCDFLKMDIDGIEYASLFAASDRVLERIGAIALEYHDYIVDHKGGELKEFLERKGFVARLESQAITE